MKATTTAALCSRVAGGAKQLTASKWARPPTILCMALYLRQIPLLDAKGRDARRLHYCSKPREASCAKW